MAQIWAATRQQLEDWLTVAQQIIDSVEFLEDGRALPSPYAQPPPQCASLFGVSGRDTDDGYK
jgi:hypothetical protein